MSLLDFTNATAADGPAFVRWLEECEDGLSFLSDTSRKRVQRWRAGMQASYWAIDQILVERGRHPSEVPDEIWIPYRNGRRTEAA
ncbi:MAG TPA: hypothetical protein VF715_03620 [Thermoleophilaceae bacterium]|jgi:pyruvate/2-oxoacid:ferredoxin oxidoreductase beta subunit